MIYNLDHVRICIGMVSLFSMSVIIAVLDLTLYRTLSALVLGIKHLGGVSYYGSELCMHLRMDCPSLKVWMNSNYFSSTR